MRRWLVGIAFFLVVVLAGVALKATDYGAATTTTVNESTTSTATDTSNTSPGDSAPESTTSTTGPPVPEFEPGADDALVLEQPEAPRIAAIDYDAFPTGADPSDPAGTTYHVSVDGDDLAAGSEDQPFATIDRALAVAADGDRVLVHGGIYSSAGLNVTASRFLLAEAGDGEVVVEASTPGAAYGLAVSSPGQHDVKVRGLRLSGFDGVGIRCGNPASVTGVAFEDLVVEDSNVGLAGYFDTRGIIVDGLLVRRLTMLGVRHSGLRFGVGGAGNARVVGLHVLVTGDRSGGEGTLVESPAGIIVESGDNVLVENSIVEGVRGDGIALSSTRSAVVSTVVRHVAGRGIVLRNGGDLVNALVFDTGGDAQLLTGEGSYRVVNSTFAYHNRGGERSYAAAFGLDTADAPVDVSLLNCVFLEQPGPVYFPSRATVRMENNVFWRFPDMLVDWGVRQWGAEDLDKVGPGNIEADPLLVDPARGDFHPGVGSPLFGAGGSTELTPGSDLLGVPRVESITAGAFQTTRSGIQHTPGAGSTTSTTSGS